MRDREERDRQQKRREEQQERGFEVQDDIEPKYNDLRSVELICPLRIASPMDCHD